MKITTLHDRQYVTLDHLDRRILDELNKNARVSYTDIGELIGLTRVAVQLRINTMIEHGVIERFTVLADPDKVGLFVPVCIDITVQPNRLKEIAKILIDDVHITYLCQLTGNSKLRAHGQFKNHKEMEHYLKTELYPLEGIVDVEVQILFKEYKNRMMMRELASSWDVGSGNV